MAKFNPALYNVMIVSDDPDFLWKYHHFFRESDFNVHAASCSVDCAHNYFDGNIRIDLIVLDDNMWKSNAVIRDVMDWDKYADILVLGSQKYLNRNARDAVIDGSTYDNYLPKTSTINNVIKTASGMLENKIRKYVTLAEAAKARPLEVLANA